MSYLTTRLYKAPMARVDKRSQFHTLIYKWNEIYLLITTLLKMKNYREKILNTKFL